MDIGVVAPGGGVALIRAIPAVSALAKGLDADEKLGAEIITRALEKPIRPVGVHQETDAAVRARNWVKV